MASDMGFIKNTNISRCSRIHHNFSILNKFTVEVFRPIFQSAVKSAFHSNGGLSGYISMYLADLIDIVEDNLFKDVFSFHIHKGRLLNRTIVKYVLFRMSNLYLFDHMYYFILHASDELLLNIYVSISHDYTTNVKFVYIVVPFFGVQFDQFNPSSTRLLVEGKQFDQFNSSSTHLVEGNRGGW